MTVLANPNENLSGMQVQFVELVVGGMTPVQAARKIGYSAPHVVASRLTHTPKIQRAIHAGTVARFSTEVGPLALQAIIDAMKADQPTNIRIKAADIGLKHLREISVESLVSAAQDMDTSSLERTLAELREHVAALEKVEANGPMIDVTPSADAGLFD
jgi:hypothetical protein